MSRTRSTRPAAAPAYSAQDAAVFETLAGLANTAFSATAPPILPSGWGLLAIAQAGSFRGLQAFFAKGEQPSTQNVIGVLALGLQWLPLLNWYDITEHQLNSLAPYLVQASSGTQAGAAVPPREPLEAGPTGQFDFGYQTLYGYLRSALWPALSFVRGLDLFIVGHGPAAPLAQLAALDLRPAKPNTTSPVKSVTVYTFSTPALGDEDFQSFFQQQVPGCWAGVAQGTSLIDFFPQPPAGGPWVQPSNVQAVPASLPTWDDPWYERSSEFYGSALGTPPFAAAPAPAPVQVQQGAAAFDADLAYALAQLSALAYQQYQHPNLPLNGVSWTLAGNVQTDAGVTLASIFRTPTQVAVAFRGTVSWEELFTIQGNYFFTTPSYLPPGPQVSTGISQVYTSLRQNLFTALQGIAGLSGLSFYLTGHSLGGALATLCAADLLNPPAGVPKPTALYTFGAPPCGDTNFQTFFAGSALAGITCRIARDFDIMPNASFQGTLAQAPEQPQLLSGTTPLDGVTFHPVTTYIDLLSP